VSTYFLNLLLNLLYKAQVPLKASIITGHAYTRAASPSVRSMRFVVLVGTNTLRFLVVLSKSSDVPAGSCYPRISFAFDIAYLQQVACSLLRRGIPPAEAEFLLTGCGGVT
jgi:hypothetical protein